MGANEQGKKAARTDARSLTIPVLAALTLGLAPLTPQPHLVGKLRWVFGGAHGMSAVDWFDLAMHAAPWLWLFWSIAGLPRASDRTRRFLGFAALLSAVGCLGWSVLSPN